MQKNSQFLPKNQQKLAKMLQITRKMALFSTISAFSSDFSVN